ncbi:ABC transporter permease [Roseovarius sp. EL26]|uniref:cell division protein FtsX n=1 Tax=Roseovarius sp. EL26 TaxID=2126672 RepID=UPI000EA38834|nr:FtsX-like permease family protein [Roseovarius sp. EL26]
MKIDFSKVTEFMSGDTQADKVVPPTGYTAWLTLFSSGAMAFLAVFVLSFSFATGKLADHWGAELSRSSTIKISAPQGQLDNQTKAVLKVLETTPGVARARALSDDEQRALLEPWFGPNVPVDALPIPRLIEVIEDRAGFDADGLRLRLNAEAPGATLDDHTRWRQPLITAAKRLRFFGWMSLLLIAATTGAIITLAANAALAANKQVIDVLRLVGARDGYIVNAFVRRFTLRAMTGSAVGMILASIAILLLPAAQTEGGFLTDLGFTGTQWLWPLLVPSLAATVAFAATRFAASKILRETP